MARRTFIGVSGIAQELCLGDHVALFYKTKAEQLSVVIPYIALGLARNERCLYIADDNSVGQILRRLQLEGVDTAEAMARDALRVVTKHETYLRHGLFEPAKMIADLQREVEVSLKSGFKGFRATGEMSWALDLPSALARMLSYEAGLHRNFPTEFIGLCQYDETRFPPHIVQGMADIHPVLIRGGKVIRKEFDATHVKY